MRQRSWLVAAVAALFALQTPLCALGCLDFPSPTVAHTSQADPPCHSDTSHPTPPESPDSHDDCGCQLEPDAVVSSGDAPISVVGLAQPTGEAFPGRLPSRTRFAFSVPGEGDLPPPDILLLKATLLI